MSEMRKIFVAGIGTDVGKTMISSIMVEALKADYWKPIQAGCIDETDSLWVRDFISNDISQIHKEQFLLAEPISPHAAANLEGKHIGLSDFELPQTSNNLIIEGAGGLMVPLNNFGETILDLIPFIADEVVLVSKNYLGSINHTLMSIELLKSRGLKLSGIIFNGDSNPETESIILNSTDAKCLAYIPNAESDLKEFVRDQAALIKL